MALHLDDALDAVGVHECDDMNDACEASGIGRIHPNGWWGVSTDAAGGVVAYFATERRAFEYRLFLVNQLVNPVEAA